MPAAEHIGRTVLKRLFDPITPGGTVSSLRIRYRHPKWVSRMAAAARQSMVFGRKGCGRAMRVEGAACRNGNRDTGFERRCHLSSLEF
jgi:hypothetical protein